MNRKHISHALILLVGSTIFPIGSSFALTAPVAKNDFYNIHENDILDIPAPGVLTNDTSTGKTLSALLVSDVRNGTLMLNANGSFVYVPDLDFHGVDIFRYVSSDGTKISNVTNVTIAVSQITQSLTARNDSYMVNENSTLTVSGNGVLVNDTDPNGRQMQAILANSTHNGNLVLNQNGSFTYTPNFGFHGIDSFTYRTFDGLATSNTATVTITVKESIMRLGGNPILVLISQIQDLISRIANIENKINELEQQNNALENRVHQLEQEMQNITSNVGSSTSQQNNDQENQQNSDQNNQEGNGEHQDVHSNNNHHGQDD